MQNLISVDELTKELKISRPTVYSMLRKGMPSLKVGRRRKFQLAKVYDWLEKQGKWPTPKDKSGESEFSKRIDKAAEEITERHAKGKIKRIKKKNTTV